MQAKLIRICAQTINYAQFCYIIVMLAAQRRHEIVRLVECAGSIAVEDLAHSLGASAATIRRDLATLDAAGRISRIHGGATSTDPDHEQVPFATAAATDQSHKESIAECAAGLVTDGDAVLLDIGTTTMALARLLRRRRITVITTSLAVLDVLRGDPAVSLVLLGGQVESEYHSLVGPVTDVALAHIHADIAFLGASGVTVAGAVLDSTQAQVPVKKAIMRAADRVVLLADANKLPGSGTFKVCDLRDLDAVITNAGADPATIDAARAAGLEVFVI